MFTLELIKEYLVYKKTMYNYFSKSGNEDKSITGDFSIREIITQPESLGIDEHPVAMCEYQNLKGDFIIKKVHITLEIFNDWILLRRNDLIDNIIID